RQDYMNYWLQCREVTIELSSAKLLATENLNNYWNYNKQSLLNFLEECLYGVRGTVTTACDEPLDAMIWIVDHDDDGDSSMVFTDPDIGNYHRLIEPGTYDIVASSDGYISDTVKNIVVTLGNVVLVNFELFYDSISLKTEPIFINDTLFYDQILNHNIIISNDSSAITTTYNIEIENAAANNWLELNKNSGILFGTENDTVVVTLNSELLSAGYFSANILLTSADSKIDTIPVNIVVKDTISTRIEPLIIIDTLWGGDNSEYEIIIENDGCVSLDYLIEIENSAENSWINLSENSGNLLLTETDTIQATINTMGIGFGNFNCNIIIEKESSTNDTIPVFIFVKDTIASEVNPISIIDTLDQDSGKEYPIVIKNIGNSILDYSAILDFPVKSDTWISLDNETGSILPEYNDTIIVIINTNDIESGDYVCALIIYENDGDNFSIPIEINVNKIQSIDIRPEITEFKLYPNPFSDQINIEFYVYSSDYVKISMFNICGNVIFEKDINTLDNNKNNIVLNDLFNIQNISKGIYFLQISTSNYQVTKRLIKN
ncbi:MAG: T9SS type A sorting domain-containing protein, partial [Bacteroidales bacterium]|nr:T9SS type A sorting domain-containing protein [Bacteroidales bacterium]